MSGVDEIPLPSAVPGRLFAAGLTAVGADPDAAVDRVAATCLVSLQDDEELDRRFPAFRGWLAQQSRVEVIRAPIPDWGTAPDDRMVALVHRVVERLHGGASVLTHCGAGMGRTGVLCILVLVGLGVPLPEARERVRAARAGAGPDSELQAEQIVRLSAILG